MFSLNQKHIHKKVFYSFDALGGYTGEYEEKPKVTEKVINTKDIPGRKTEVLKKFNDTLKGRLSSLGIPFNTEAFGKRVEGVVNTVLDSTKIPDIAKQKFLDDLESKMELFTKISKDDIQALRDYRTSSLQLIGQSGLEESQFIKKDRNGKLVKMDEMDIQRHYLRMILDANLAKYVEGSALGLKSAFEEKNTALTQGMYNEPAYKEYTSGITEADKKYGLNLGKEISKKLEAVMKGRQEAISGNSDIILQGVIKSELLIQYGTKNPEFGKRYANIISKISQDSSYPVNLDMMRDKVDGKIISMKDIYESYLGIYRNWTKKEGEIRSAREAALTDSTLSKTKKWLGFEQLESEFSALDQGQMEQKLAQSSKADFALAILQAAQITPALGDALGVNFDTRSAILGIDADGKKLSGTERTVAGVMGPLGLLFVGGTINKLRKGSKALTLIAAIKKVIPTKLEDWNKEAGGLGSEFMKKFEKFMKWIGEGVVDKADGYMRDRGLQPKFVSKDESKQALAWKRSTTENTTGIGLSGEANRADYVMNGLPEGSNVGLVPDEWIDNRLKALGYTDSSGDDNVRITKREVMTLLLEKARREKDHIIVNEGIPISLPIQQRSLESLSNELEYLRMGKKEDARSTPAEGRLVAEIARRHNRGKYTVEDGRYMAREKAIALNQNIEETAKAKGIKPDDERIFRIGEKFPELKQLTTEQKEELITIHNIGKDGESVTNYGIGSLGDKLSKTKELLTTIGIQSDRADEIARTLIREGYLGRLADLINPLNPDRNTRGRVERSILLTQKKQVWRGEAYENGSFVIKLSPEYTKIQIDTSKLRKGDWIIHEESNGGFTLVQFEGWTSNNNGYKFSRGGGQVIEEKNSMSIMSNKIADPGSLGLRYTAKTEVTQLNQEISAIRVRIDSKKQEIAQFENQLNKLSTEERNAHDKVRYEDRPNNRGAFYAIQDESYFAWDNIRRAMGRISSLKKGLEKEVNDLVDTIKLKEKAIERGGYEYNGVQFSDYPTQILQGSEKFTPGVNLNLPINHAEKGDLVLRKSGSTGKVEVLVFTKYLPPAQAQFQDVSGNIVTANVSTIQKAGRFDSDELKQKYLNDPNLWQTNESSDRRGYQPKPIDYIAAGLSVATLGAAIAVAQSDDKAKNN